MRLNGWAMKAIREARGLSGSQCARDLKISQAYWSNWERGTREASPARVVAIAQVLGVDYRAVLVDPTEQDVEELRSAVLATAAS